MTCWQPTFWPSDSVTPSEASSLAAEGEAMVPSLHEYASAYMNTCTFYNVHIYIYAYMYEGRCTYVYTYAYTYVYMSMLFLLGLHIIVDTCRWWLQVNHWEECWPHKP